MSTNLLAVKAFLDKVKNIGFWERIFQWNNVKKDLVDAAGNLAALQNELSTSQHELATTQMHLSVLQEAKRSLETQLQFITHHSSFLSLTLRLNQIPHVSIQVSKHANGSVRLLIHLPHNFNSVGHQVSIISFNIIRVQK